MDHLISAAGKKNHAVLLDCKTMAYETIPIPKGISFLVMDTKTRRELSNSAYNTRHEEVIHASRTLEVGKLRDATHSLLADKKEKLLPILYRRARHVLTENNRVKSFVEAMRNEDIVEMGVLINDSHVSLRDDFEVSSHELNLIVSLAQNQPSCLGARMTGAGFGGCALALTENANVSQFIDRVSQQYFTVTGTKPNIFKIESADGVQYFPV